MGDDDLSRGSDDTWIDLVDHAGAASAARVAVTEVCWRWHLPELVDTATLLVTELVTNAVRHAQPPIALRITRPQHGLLHVAVADHGLHPPKPDLHPDTTTPGGRGLFLVDSLATRWGHRFDGQGKTVWFELARDEPGR